MIWSQPVRDLRRYEGMLERNGSLRHTTLLESEFEDRNIPHDPVKYLTIPPVQHHIGKLVVPYVSLNARGMISENTPAFYAVTERPNDANFGKGSVVQRSKRLTS